MQLYGKHAKSGSVDTAGLARFSIRLLAPYYQPQKRGHPKNPQQLSIYDLKGTDWPA